jgi:hypothetical protein
MLYNYKTYLEKKVNKEDLDVVYNKYYKDIDYKTFKEIVESDPTSTIDGKLYLGKYSKWLLNLFKNKKLKLEDLYKVKDYIELFDKQSVRNKLSILKRNINNYESLGELAKELEPFKEDEEILSNQEKKDKNFVKSFNKFDLYIPRTFEDSCILGKGTEWCTATEKTDKWYKKYHKPGRELLIFISKEEPKEKYQFHFRTKQFMDKFDEEIDIKEFLNDNPDRNEWLKENEKGYKRAFNNYNIYLNYKNLTTLKGQEIPEIVEGNFSCFNNQLTSLEGSPEIVEGNFNCRYNKLTSLEGAPEIVEGNFYCSNNNLTTLKGAPEIVEGNFSCSHNELNTLEGSPEIVKGNFSCSWNKLTSLKGAPKKVEGVFNCSHNELNTLEGCPELVEGNFYCSNNNLTKKDIEWLKQNCDIKGDITFMP